VERLRWRCGSRHALSPRNEYGLTKAARQKLPSMFASAEVKCGKKAGEADVEFLYPEPTGGAGIR